MLQVIVPSSGDTLQTLYYWIMPLIWIHILYLSLCVIIPGFANHLYMYSTTVPLRNRKGYCKIIIRLHSTNFITDSSHLETWHHFDWENIFSWGKRLLDTTMIANFICSSGNQDFIFVVLYFTTKNIYSFHFSSILFQTIFGPGWYHTAHYFIPSTNFLVPSQCVFKSNAHSINSSFIFMNTLNH
jgi:hypothetical protein